MTEQAQAPEIDPALLQSLQQLGHNALQGSMSNEADPHAQFVVPRGWTTLIHGTNVDRWDIGADTVTISGMGLSAITAETAARHREDARRVGNPDAYNTTGGYAAKGAPTAQSVEVRTLFYRDDLAAGRGALPDVRDIRASLDDAKRDLIAKYHQPRHPIIPRHEVLLRLGPTCRDPQTGRLVEYFVPQSVAADYIQAVTNEQK